MGAELGGEVEFGFGSGEGGLHGCARVPVGAAECGGEVEGLAGGEGVCGVNGEGELAGGVVGCVGVFDAPGAAVAVAGED